MVAGQGGVVAHLEDVVVRRQLADGPYFYHAVKVDEKRKAYTLDHAAVSSVGRKIVIRGQLAGLDVEQTFSLPARPSDHGGTHRPAQRHEVSGGASEFEAGLTLRVTDAAGKLLPETAGDHWAAVPFLRRADFGERGGAGPAARQCRPCDPRGHRV